MARERLVVATLSLLLLAAVPCCVHAQSDEGLTRVERRIRRVRRLTDSLDATLADTRLAPKVARVRRRMDKSNRLDTTYIDKPGQPLTLKLRANVSGSDVMVNSVYDGEPVNLDLRSDLKTTLSLSATLHGLGVALALNPMKLFGRYSDFELNVNSYGNRMGFDIIYNQTGSYRGTITRGGDGRRFIRNNGGETIDMGKGIMRQRMLTLDGYYAFNHRHFSYPAAFSQSQVQLRSCGSLLLGSTVMVGDMETDAEVMARYGQQAVNTHIAQWSLGAGYGYNLVLRRGWLLHLSMVPQLVVLAHNTMESGGVKDDMRLSFPNIVVNGRMAVVHNRGNRFYGVSAIINTNRFGRGDTWTENVKWRSRLFYGIRL